MRNFFGVIFIIAGILWSLVFIITGFNSWSDFSGTSIFSTIILVAIGLFVIWLGKKIFKGKKDKASDKISDANSMNIDEEMQRTQVSPEPQAKDREQVKDPVLNNPTPLKEVRQMVESKIVEVPSSTLPINTERLKQSLYSLNGEKMPFEFMETNDKNVDLVSVWKMADAKYLGVLGLSKNKIQEEFSVHLKFNEEKGELRCKDKLKRKSSSFGFGGADMEFSSFSGKTTSSKKEIVFGRKKDGKVGKVVDISLDTTILQNAIKQVAEKSGWKVKRVTGKL